LEALSSFSPAWSQTFGVSDTYPTALTRLPNFKTAFGNVGVTTKLANFPNQGIGFVGLPFLTQAEENVKQVFIKNKAGNSIDPSMSHDKY
jgi:hypothetical protein